MEEIKKAEKPKNKIVKVVNPFDIYGNRIHPVGLYDAQFEKGNAILFRNGSKYAVVKKSDVKESK